MLVPVDPGVIGNCICMVECFLGCDRAYDNRCVVGDFGHNRYLLLCIEKGTKRGTSRENRIIRVVSSTYRPLTYFVNIKYG